eukprot:COSAG06_NODE_25388_length_638_cov_0.962894_2_plen_84_part_01
MSAPFFWRKSDHLQTKTGSGQRSIGQENLRHVIRSACFRVTQGTALHLSSDNGKHFIDPVRNTPLFEMPFIYNNDHFTKTGSGQ